MDKSIHYSLAVIRSWDVNFNIFYSCRINKMYTIINHNKLKNVFLKFVNDVFFWVEIEKLIINNIIDLSQNFIYYFPGLFHLGCLSRFFFDIYLREFDNYIIQFSRSVSLKKFFFKKLNFVNLLNNSVDSTIKFYCYYPIRLNIILAKFLNLRFLFIQKHLSLTNLIYKLKYFVFSKYFNYVRYLDYFILGLSSSISFSVILKKKIFNFIRSSLHLDLSSFNLFLKNDNINFATYVIKLTNLSDINYLSVSRIKSNKKYFLRILQRVNFYLRF